MFQVSSQMDTSSQLTELLQKNPSFETFLKDNPQIYQLLQSNPELVNHFKINPNLIKQTVEHAKFMNSFLTENANLNQIIKDNPNVYAFILKQVDHAVETGENKTIVIQMTEADENEVQKELQKAQQTLKESSQSVNAVQTTATKNNVNTAEAITQHDVLSGYSREELLAMLAKYQVGQQSLDKQTLSVQNQLPATNENTFLSQTSMPKQQSNYKETVSNYNGQIPSLQGGNPNSAISTVGLSSFNSQSRPNGQVISNKNSNDPTVNVGSGTSAGISIDNSDDIDVNNIEDLKRLRLLYIAIYNQEPKSIMDLQDFYNVVLTKLNIRTRKQVNDFHGRFKSSGGKDSGVQYSSFQSRPNGASGITYISNGYYSVNKRPTLKERKMQCKIRKFCRKYSRKNSPICRQQEAMDGM